MKFSSLFLLTTLIFISTAAAKSKIPLESVYCNKIQRIESWSYDKSDSTHNGQRYRAGLITVKMWGISARGGKLFVMHTFPVPGLEWNENFTRLTHGDSLCAVQGRYGIRTFSKNCSLNLRLATATVNQTQQNCANSQDAVVLEGTFYAD